MGGKAGSTFAKLLGQSPEKQIKVDLSRLKQVIETGEVAAPKGNPPAELASSSRVPVR